AALAPLAEEKGNAPALLDARKILGGIHLDQLFSRVPMPGKYEYAVGRTKGDNLHSIASRFRSTVTFLQRVNQLPGSVIHPGDRLVVCPLDFTVEIDLRGKRLTVRRDGKFFSDYALRGMELPMATLPGDAVVADTSGWSGDRRIRQDAPEFSGAEKRLQIAVAEAGSIVLRKVPDSGAAPGPSLYLAESDLGELTAIIRPGTPVRFLTDSLKS
ncbi:MAG: LysM peptidoglycan-binding domain-containing protein, partial [Verrucomicrobiota bacterium]